VSQHERSDQIQDLEHKVFPEQGLDWWQHINCRTCETIIGLPDPLYSNIRERISRLACLPLDQQQEIIRYFTRSLNAIGEQHG
jgi:hypothetical protein